jgi:PKD repeat protein
VVSYTHALTPADLGAYEYQHRAPTAVADVQPGSSTFDGKLSSDPDDGDTLSYAWTFDDGATATGVTVTHPFNTPGVHTVELTVTDPTGLTSSQTITVWVPAPPPRIGPPSPPSPPATPASTNPAPPHLTVLGRPSVTGSKVTLRLSCTGTTACTGIRITETAHRGTVKVASVTLGLNAGQTRTIAVTLDVKGTALVKHFAKLPITIAVTIPIAGETATVKTAHATLHPPKKPRLRP